MLLPIIFYLISAKSTRKEWTREEKQAVHDHLENNIRRGVVPGKKECEKCKNNSNGALDDREWRAIKYYVKNQIDRRGNKK